MRWIFIFICRWDGRCIITCPKNYEKRINEERGEYACIPKECEDRTPWRNESCSLKEDFSNSNFSFNSLSSGCYYLRESYINNNNDIYNNNSDDSEYGRCVSKEECPSDYPGVYFLCFLRRIFFFYFSIVHCLLVFLSILK
jgi:hypothetical protein